MLNCRDVTQLVSTSLERDLSWLSRVRVWVHLGLCRFCRRFRRDVLHLREQSRQYAAKLQQEAANGQVTLSPEARARIARALTPPE